MELEIRNSDLSSRSVPSTPTDPRALATFALSFDGYAHWGDRCGALAEAAAAEFRTRGTVPRDLSDLRACLFYEQQRWRWNGIPAKDDDRAYMQALLDAIRDAAGGRA